MATEKVSHEWVYHNSIDRHRPVFMAMQFSLFFIGVLFWIDAMTDGDGFREETWGWLAYSFPAVGWAFLNMATSAITMMGLMRPVRNWMIVFGSSSHIAQFLVLSYSATMCGGVFVIGLYASVFFLPLNLWMLLEALRRD